MRWRRRALKKRSRRRANRLSYYRFRTSTPDTVKFKLNWSEYTALPGGSALNSIKWRANSPFKPLVGTGGGQPPGFDTLTLNFRKFLVTGCKITIDLIPAYAAGSAWYLSQMTLWAATDYNFLTVNGLSTNELRQYKRDLKWRYVIPNSNGFNTFRIKMYRTTQKMFGFKRGDHMMHGEGTPTATENAYWCTSTSDPSTACTWYYGFRLSTIDGSSNLIGGSLITNITYYGIARDKIPSIDV